MHIVVIVFIFLSVSATAGGSYLLITNYLDGSFDDSSVARGSVELVINNGSGSSSGSSESTPNKVIIDELTGEPIVVSSGKSGGSSGGGSGSGSSEGVSEPEIIEEITITCDYPQEIPIQYSLKNFQEAPKCLNHFEGKCINFTAFCAVDVYNLDKNVNGTFEVKYSLIDSSNIILKSVLIESKVDISSPITFKANFDVADVGGIDALSNCKLEMINIPTKQVCK